MGDDNDKLGIVSLRDCNKRDIPGGVKKETSDIQTPQKKQKKRERVRRKCEFVKTVWIISGRVCDRYRDVGLAQEEDGRAGELVEKTNGWKKGGIREQGSGGESCATDEAGANG